MFLASKEVLILRASTLDAALDLIHAKKIRLIMLDYNMPGIRFEWFETRVEARWKSGCLDVGHSIALCGRRSAGFLSRGFCAQNVGGENVSQRGTIYGDGGKIRLIDFMTADDPTVAPNPLAQKLSRRELQVLEAIERQIK